jgi:hypothetical protein
MKKTGRGVPMELQGPLQHVPGHEGGGTDTDPGKGLTRPGNAYQPQFQANVMGTPTRIIPAGPRQNPDTGENMPLIYTSARRDTDTPGSQVTTRRITPESQNIARNRTNESVATQTTIGDGKMVKLASTNKLKSNFKDYAQGSAAFSNAARAAGMDVSNINQAELTSRITQARNTNQWNSGGRAALELQDRIYDTHRRDTTDVADLNRIVLSNRTYEKNQPTLESTFPKMYKKKK